MRQVLKSQTTRQSGDWNDRGEPRSKSRPRLEPTTDYLILSWGDESLDSDGDHDDDSGDDSNHDEYEGDNWSLRPDGDELRDSA